MTESFAAHFIGPHRNRPLSLLAVASALILPGFLLLFLTHPALVESASLPELLLLSIAPSVPIVLLCFAFWYSLMRALVMTERLLAGLPAEDRVPAELAFTRPDPFEWPSFLAGGYLANGILYCLVAWAYLKPISMGRTLLLTAGILLLVWLLECGLLGWAIHHLKKAKKQP
jgi:hypothetical protein